jgi:DNA topoisomerase VI subunit B
MAKGDCFMRTHFTIGNSADYFNIPGLVKQTGQPAHNLGNMAVKELLDNALDACETANVDPVITVRRDECSRVTITDNGLGMPPHVVESLLDFTSRTSDKADYRSPSRGQQGQALKTLVGLPFALNEGQLIIEACGLRHEIQASSTPAGTIDTDYTVAKCDKVTGTSISIDLARSHLNIARIVKLTRIVNPHARFTLINEGDENV